MNKKAAMAKIEKKIQQQQKTSLNDNPSYIIQPISIKLHRHIAYVSQNS